MGAILQAGAFCSAGCAQRGFPCGTNELPCKMAAMQALHWLKVDKAALTLCNIQWLCRYSRPFSVMIMYALMSAGFKTKLLSLIITCSV